ncbi:MAG: hypothetical protein KC466_16225 [Myxococcales bacterium]|nr:hypothetical protein [Myxococcales bacterium]
MGRLKTLLAVTLLAAQTGCASTIKNMVADQMVGTFNDVNNAALKGKDPQLVRDGMPGSIMILDGLIEGVPEHAGLLKFGAMVNALYAFIFIEEEDPARAKIYYEKGKSYALRSIRADHPDFDTELPYESFKAQLADFDADEVDVLFWLEMSWASWINLSLTSPAAIADAAKVQALMEKTIELDETFFNGGPQLLAGVYYGSRSEMFGGNRDKSHAHFERCFEITGGRFLMAYVFYARFPAIQWQEIDKFREYLQKVIDAPDDILPQETVANTMAKRKARVLLDDIGEYFDIEVPEDDEDAPSLDDAS